MKRRGLLLARHGARLAVALALLLSAGAALARAGGGHSYSGSHHTGGGGGGGGGDGGGLILLLVELLFRYPAIGVPVLVIAVVGFVVTQRRSGGGEGFSTGAGDLGQTASAQVAARAGVGGGQLAALRAEDPDFSEPLFLDFAAALIGRAVTAAGSGRLADVERYLTDAAVLEPFAGGGWQGVVVGSTALRSAQLSPDGAVLLVDAVLGATGAPGGRWWHAAWLFSRRRGVRSKGPGEITRLACPSCGSAAERTPDGACSHCGQRPAPGEAAWALSGVRILTAEGRPPVSLGGYAEEEGNALPTVQSPGLQADLAAVAQQVPGFTPEVAKARFTEVFTRLQDAWSRRDLDAIRLLTTDAVFGSWRYWIVAYQSAGLQNRLTGVQVRGLEPARAQLDRWYAAVTVRVFASMVDQTVDARGRVVGGSGAPRPFSEYWTFVRTLSAAQPEVTCPGCGASLPAGQTGQCPYCGSLVGAPAFDWILSRIDQDEDYGG